jgi:hypothetical protein
MSQTAPLTSDKRPLTFGRIARWLLVLVCTVCAEVGIDAVAAQQSLLGVAASTFADTVWVERIDTVFASSGDLLGASPAPAWSAWNTAVVVFALVVGLAFGTLLGATARARAAASPDEPTR